MGAIFPVFDARRKLLVGAGPLDVAALLDAVVLLLDVEEVLLDVEEVLLDVEEVSLVVEEVLLISFIRFSTLKPAVSPVAEPVVAMER